MTAPVCANCGKPATCFGEYETCGENPGFACDDCCGHGNEDGWCKPVKPEPAGAQVIDLMDALRKSLQRDEKQQGGKDEKGTHQD